MISTHNIDLIRKTATMNLANEHGMTDSVLPEIADCIDIFNKRLNSIETTQRALESQIKLGKISNEKITRFVSLTSKVFINTIESFYCLKSSVQSYMAELNIDDKFKEFKTKRKEEDEEEEGTIWSVELYDFTDSNTPTVEDIIAIP